MINELWGESGPYSQAQLITEVRILDDKISRTFLIVSVNINPFTMRLIRKHANIFKDDDIVMGIIKNVVYKGPKDGYSVYVFQDKYSNESVMKEAKIILQETTNAIIRMHKFVLQTLKDGTKDKGGKTFRRHGTQQEKMFATQRIMSQTFIERYLKEAGRDELAGIEEANMVLERAMEWWNNKLSINDRKMIETLSHKEQKKIFMAADVDFSASPKIGRNDPCPCGSGVKYKKCCFLKLH